MAESRHLQFKIQGMDCAEEIAILKREIGPLVGGEVLLAFDLLNAKMTVRLEGPTVTAETISAAVSKTGMKASLWKLETKAEHRTTSFPLNRHAIFTVASGIFGVAGFLAHVLLEGSIRGALGSEGTGVAHPVPLAAKGLYLLGILAGVWLVLPKAWFALKRARPDMNLLMTIAVVGAVVLGDWFEAATVSFLFALSLALESWSIGRARRAVESLLSLTPTLAWLRDQSGVVREVDPIDVPVGAIILVKPGERLPLDGEIVHGNSYVNQAPITGESEPVAKKPGDQAFAGTINGNDVLEIRTTKPAGESTLAHIIRLVGDAQAKRAPSEQWVERFAQVYTPTVLAIALAVAFLPPMFLGDWAGWLYRALVLLVIACPCALVISTPVSIVAALASAARQGVLVKGGLHIESPATLEVLAFDKTGTLTEGKPRVQEVIPWSEHSESELLERAASLESHSEHPLAKAILFHAKEKGIAVIAAEDFRSIPGKGAIGLFQGKEFWLGSHRFLEEKGMETPEVHSWLQELSRMGRSVVVIGNEKHVCGFITVADSLRPDANAVINALRLAGVKRIVMLSGDNRETAQAMGAQAGVDEVQAELLPAEKVKAVESLAALYGSVGMVGDGINDAPALARASVGIAMGAMGSDAAIETADIALMSDDLSRLPWLIHHSRRTLGIIRQNIALSLTIKGVFVVLTVAGHASMWAAIAADMGASLLVIFNGLRLLRDRK
jgi:Cd2+/Zn2+-exporting ATPase